MHLSFFYYTSDEKLFEVSSFFPITIPDNSVYNNREIRKFLKEVFLRIAMDGVCHSCVGQHFG